MHVCAVISTETWSLHVGQNHNHHKSTNTQGRSQQWGGLSRLSPAVAMVGERCVRGAGSARRRRERRLRCMLRHERQTVAMALAEQLHHSANRVERDAAPRRQTTRAREGEVREEHHALRGQTRPLPGMRPAPVQEPRPQVGIQRHRVIGYELVLNPVVPQMAEQLVEVSLPALAVEYISPAPAVFQASSPAAEHHALAPAVIPAPAPVVENIAPAPAVLQAPTPVVENIAPAPAVFHSPTPVVEKYCTRASSSSCAGVCGGVFFTRASSVLIASARCGVSCTCAGFVHIASARWVFLTCASCVSCWRSSRLCPRTEFRLSSWT